MTEGGACAGLMQREMESSIVYGSLDSGKSIYCSKEFIENVRHHVLCHVVVVFTDLSPPSVGTSSTPAAQQKA